MGRRRPKSPEQAFEYRVEALLRKKGFLTLNCARSKPFDIIAVKGNVGIPIELKARSGHWSAEQEKFQKDLAKNSENGFMFIAQNRKRNKRGYMIDVVHFVYNKEDDGYTEIAREIMDAFTGCLNSVKVKYL